MEYVVTQSFRGVQRFSLGWFDVNGLWFRRLVRLQSPWISCQRGNWWSRSHVRSDSFFKPKLENEEHGTIDIDNFSETLVIFNLNYLLNSLSIRLYDYKLILFSYYGCLQFDWYLTDLDRKSIDRNFLQINFKCILISENGTSDTIIKK